MRHRHLLIAASLAVSATFVVPAYAGERLGFPPPDPSGIKRPKMTADSVRQEFDQRLKNKFAAAAGPSGRLTAQQAKDAGWGFIADHFDEIAGNNGDSVSLDEVRGFMAARSPLPKPLPVAKAKDKLDPEEAPKPFVNGPIQIIE